MRADLKELKQKYLQINYKKQVEEPKNMLKDKDRTSKDRKFTDGRSYYELKYFLTQKQEKETLEEKKSDMMKENRRQALTNHRDSIQLKLARKNRTDLVFSENAKPTKLLQLDAADAYLNGDGDNN